MTATLGDSAAGEAKRIDTARRLIALNDSPDTITTILDQITPQAPPELAAGLISALSDSNEPALGDVLVRRWDGLSPAARQAAANVLKRRPQWTAAMLGGIKSRTVERTALTAGDWQVLKQHRDESIASLARELEVGQIDPDRAKVYEKLKPVLNMKGDPLGGKLVFTKICAQCHTIEGVGGKVGPDLTGIGARDPRDLLMEIVDPNRSVEANYRLWTASTIDGLTYAGRLDAETKTTVEILDLQGNRHVIAREDIDTLTASTLSIMPVGLEEVGPEALADLIAYLGTSREKKE
jgi:hypothetical protein